MDLVVKSTSMYLFGNALQFHISQADSSVVMRLEIHVFNSLWHFSGWQAKCQYLIPTLYTRLPPALCDAYHGELRTASNLSQIQPMCDAFRYSLDTP